MKLNLDVVRVLRHEQERRIFREIKKLFGFLSRLLNNNNFGRLRFLLGWRVEEGVVEPQYCSFKGLKERDKR